MNLNEMEMKSEIILYQPNDAVRLEVKVENDSIWLNRQQIATLFDRDVKTIGKHITNALKEELSNLPTVAKFATVQIEGGRNVVRNIEYYNLEVITSVGYRVKSSNGVLFRIWANQVLKDYLLKGYAFNQRLEKIEQKLSEHEEKIELFVQSALPPSEGLFFEGQVYDAFKFAKNLIISDKKRIRLIDNYIDDTTITMMSDKSQGIEVLIYTKNVTPSLQLTQTRFNSQYGNLSIKQFNLSHDRFLIIDDTDIYLFGASMKDLGKKWFGVTKMDGANISSIISRLP